MGPWKGYVEKLNWRAKSEKMSLVHNFGAWFGPTMSNARIQCGRASAPLAAYTGSIKWGVKFSHPIYLKICNPTG
jgi:hypothetical protein